MAPRSIALPLMLLQEPMNTFVNRNLTAVVCVVLMSTPVFAANRLIPYQGTLFRNGNPLKGQYELEFSLFLAATGGTSVWKEVQTLNVNSGAFSAALGAVTPLPDSVFTNDDVFLSIAVRRVGAGGDPTLVPLQNRQKLLSVPYAARALTGKATVTVDGVAQPDYSFDVRRAMFKVTHNNAFTAIGTTSRSVTIDDQQLLSLCGDEDGCMVRLAMTKWGSAPSTQTWASAMPVHFHIDPTTRAWRASDYAAVNSIFSQTAFGDVDGNGSTQHVLSAWNCFFTDGRYGTPGSGTNSDAAPGFDLLNWNTGYLGETTCILLIDD